MLCHIHLQRAKYSPHPRGCFPFLRIVIVCSPIFPASAGVFLWDSSFTFCTWDIPRIRGGVSVLPFNGSTPFFYIPRIRGGVSVLISSTTVIHEYSPNPRGCFRDFLFPGSTIFIFPASAGVFPSPPATHPPSRHIPRISGGVSQVERSLVRQEAYSPHQRGCFSPSLSLQWIRFIFPASAGVALLD